jgi:hypothetical protein
MSEIYLYIFYGLTCLTIFTCSTIIVLGIFECILLRKKRLSATIIPSKEQKKQQQEEKSYITNNSQFIDIIGSCKNNSCK